MISHLLTCLRRIVLLRCANTKLVRLFLGSSFLSQAAHRDS